MALGTWLVRVEPTIFGDLRPKTLTGPVRRLRTQEASEITGRETDDGLRSPVFGLLSLIA
jgi:hypothetical protein